MTEPTQKMVSNVALLKRIARLEEALRPFAEFAAYFDKGGDIMLKRPGVNAYRKARAVLTTNPISEETSHDR